MLISLHLSISILFLFLIWFLWKWSIFDFVLFIFFFFENNVLPNPNNQCFCPLRHRLKTYFYSNTLDSFERIPQSVHMKTPIHIHIQNQTINHIISCEHFGDAVFLAGLLQKPSKFLVLTTLLPKTCRISDFFHTARVKTHASEEGRRKNETRKCEKNGDMAVVERITKHIFANNICFWCQ